MSYPKKPKKGRNTKHMEHCKIAYTDVEEI
jgi:hypothetical protein